MTKLARSRFFLSSMKLTARHNRPIHSDGRANHPSPLPSMERHKNDRGIESRRDRDDYNGYDASRHEYHRNDKQMHNTGSTLLRRCVIWWMISRFSFKISYIVAVVLLLSIAFIQSWDHFFESGGIGDENSSSSVTTFAVVINTFRRPERLKQTVQHYAQSCGRQYNVSQVYVVWADPTTDPPPPSDFLIDSSPLSSSSLRGNTNGPAMSNHFPVEILVKSKDSLNSRFEPIANLLTTAVFMVDDDIRVACSSLHTAFQAWKKHPDSMVGYYPRLATTSATSSKTLASPTDRKQLVYHAWPMVFWRQKFNIILTKASFLHSKYLGLYTDDQSYPKEIKDLVDRNRNCEDIAMSMLVANYTKHNSSGKNEKSDSKSISTKRKALPGKPIYVEGRVSDVGLFGGISSGTGHFATRSDCLNHITDIFRSKGWGSPLEDEFVLSSRSWVRHSPGFWWQPRPSNIFEWFALDNILS